jgi:hypothetical protein
MGTFCLAFNLENIKTFEKTVEKYKKWRTSQAQPPEADGNFGNSTNTGKKRLGDAESA